MKIAICDDDKIILEKISNSIKNKLTALGLEFELSAYLKGADLIKEYKLKKFDVLFLDICMPDCGGFDIAKFVRKISDKTFIVFITTQEELIYDSFDFMPFNFIPKLSDDFLDKRLDHVIKKLIKNMRQNEKITLELSFNDKKIFYIRDIIYIMSNGNYLEYIIDNAENVTIRGKISNEEERFAEYGFVRIHNRILVNMNHIKQIDYPNKIINTSGGVLNISRNYKQNIESSYNDYLKSQF